MPSYIGNGKQLTAVLGDLFDGHPVNHFSRDRQAGLGLSCGGGSEQRGGEGARKFRGLLALKLLYRKGQRSFRASEQKLKPQESLFDRPRYPLSRQCPIHLDLENNTV